VPRITARLDEGPIWLAEDHGLAVGTVAAVTDRQGCYLRGMAVAPGARGRGVGRALVDAVLEYARSSRADRCWLYTTEFLDDAIRLYERFGFTPFTEDPPPNLHGTPLMGMERPT
jgi:GNAT superfamily N-acetyltransferase